MLETSKFGFCLSESQRVIRNWRNKSESLRHNERVSEV